MELFEEIAAAIERAEQVAQQWRGKAGWMPFNLFDFGTLLLESVTWAPGRRLLEIGAGPGPNLIFARALGWDAHGIEISEEMAAFARREGLDVETVSALDYKGYADYGAIWFNRVYRDDREAQRQLEELVLREMADAAVLICANLENPPPSSWWIINDSWDDMRRGAWAKPGSA
jgi:hypothetical protein